MRLSELQRTLVRAAYEAYFRQPTAAQRDKAKKYLRDGTTFATTALISVRYLLGPTVVSYEPETVWLETDASPLNRDKLMAAMALGTTPSYYWDYRVFGATTHALNDERVVPEYVPKCTPEQMAWSVFEAELLYAMLDNGESTPVFDEAIPAYVATCLHEEGYVVPPVGLSMAKEDLEKLIAPDAMALKSEVEDAWAKLPKDRVDPRSFGDSAVGVQMTRLADCWNYVYQRATRLREQLDAF